MAAPEKRTTGYTVHVTEVATGETRLHRDRHEFSEFMWTEGNYSCDCNRALFFSRAAGGDDPNIPCSSGRYTVRIVDDETGRVLLEETATPGKTCPVCGQATPCGDWTHPEGRGPDPIPKVYGA